jgi:hypothetical protein
MHLADEAPQQHLVGGQRRTATPSGAAGAVDLLTAQAFWVWAAIEVLRRTGARIEELLELTHLSLRQYHAPTGEMVPLLQISPSKTDHERVIPADPELVAILARIIRRIRATDGKVPLLAGRCGGAAHPGAQFTPVLRRVSGQRRAAGRAAGGSGSTGR